MKKIIGFDLDNTLYDHQQYVESAYEDISSFITNKYNVDYNVYFEWIFNRWLEKGSSYNKIFKESYQYFDLPNFKLDIEEILEIYHNATPDLIPYKEVNYVLNTLSSKYKLVMITDGSKRTQQYKIKSLRLKKFFDEVYISRVYGHDFYKPSTKMFEMCLNNNNVSPKEMLYIGDRPEIDYIPCKKLGIQFIRILKGEYKDIETENKLLEIKEINEILDVIK